MEAEIVAKKIGTGTGFLVAGSIIGYIISLFYRILLARSLGPADYGIFSLVLMLIGFFTTFFTLGIPKAVAKYISEYIAKNKSPNIIFSNALKIFLPITILSSLILFFSAPFLAFHVFNSPESLLPFQLTAVVLLFNFMGGVFSGGIVGFQRLELSALGGIIERLTKFIATLLLFYLGFGLLGAVGGIIFGFFLVMVFLIFSYNRQTSISIEATNTATIKKLLKFGVPASVTNLTGFFMASTDTLFIGIFLTVEDVGFYNVALPVLWILGLFVASLSGALFPAFSAIYAKKDNHILERVFNFSIKYAFYLLIPAIAGAYMLAAPIITILFTDTYLPAVPVFRILVFGSLFLSLKSITDSYIAGIGKPKMTMKYGIIATIVNVILNWSLIQSYGIEGAGIATIISLLLFFLLSLNFVRTTIRLNFRYLPKSLAATAVMAGIIFVIQSFIIATIVKVILIVVLGVGIYFSILYLLRGFDESDKKLISIFIRIFFGKLKRAKKILKQ